MKKVLAVIMVLSMVLVLFACGGHPNEDAIVGVWHVVDEDTETEYGLGIEFTKDGKLRYGLTEDIFTSLAEGNEKDAQEALAGLDLLVSMEYEILSDTEMEITAKAFMGLGGSETTAVTYSLDGDTLTFDGATYARVKGE